MIYIYIYYICYPHPQRSTFFEVFASFYGVLKHFCSFPQTSLKTKSVVSGFQGCPILNCNCEI